MSRRMRSKCRSLSVSLSRPRRSRAIARTRRAETVSSGLLASASTARRTRRKASSLERRVPVISESALGARRSALGAWNSGIGTSESKSSSGALSTTSSGAMSAIAGRAAPSSRSRPRPRPPRRPRRGRSESAPSARRSPLGVAEVRAGSAGAPSATSTSIWPFSRRETLMSPFAAASWQKRENLAMPRLPSSKLESISCMTCLRRSERMTSPLRFMRFTASVTSSHGSRLRGLLFVGLHEAGERVVAVVLVAVHDEQVARALADADADHVLAVLLELVTRLEKSESPERRM